MSKIRLILTAILGIIITIFLFHALMTANKIAVSAGPVLDNNWWVALNWIRENTPNCSVIATYWDPGHFITGIAERPVVFDGASQNAKRTITLDGNLTQDEIKDIIGIDNFVFKTFEKNGKVYTNVTTARIQDIATVLYTSNESQAIKILRRYVMPNCNNSMYFIASSDLIGKSQWWTYFSTWSPDTHKGTKYFYATLWLSGTKKLNNRTVYIYPYYHNQAFLIVSNGTDFDLYFQQDTNVMRIKRFVYYSSGLTVEKTYENASIDGMVWTDPSMKAIIFVPKELENSLFTRMMLFDGKGLKHFKFVKDFGWEVKLFKVEFD